MTKNKRTKKLLKEIDSEKIVINIDHLYKELQVNKDKDEFVERFSMYLEELNK